MSKVWREIADPKKHEDFMGHGHCNKGIPVKKTKDNLLQSWVYFAEADNLRMAKFMRKHEESLFRFLDHPGVEATNNRAERAIRPAVIARFELTAGH